MIPNMRQGSTPTGLATYLIGEGKRNEHENPHLVAGSGHLMAWYSDQELTHEDALSIGAEVDRAHKFFGTNVAGGHVLHASLSLPKSDRILSDDKWAQVAEDFMDRMGFIEDGKAPVRWAAVRHGVSGGHGNDHIHIAISLVRDDGTKADIWQFKNRSQRVCRELEREHKLFQVSGISSTRGYSPEEQAASLGRGRSEPERFSLETRVRAAAVSSVTEDEFVRRLRGDGVLARASLKKDGEMRGYSVALPPVGDGDRPIYYGGTTVARDLGLGVLRKRWQEGDPDKIRAEWEAATRGLRIVSPGREQQDPTFTASELSAELVQWKERLESRPITDREGWRQDAAELAGVFSAWSRATEATPGPLADTARELSRSAQVPRKQYRPAPNPARGARAALFLTYMATQDDPRAALAVFQRVASLAGSVHRYQRESGDMVRQTGLERIARERLEALQEKMQLTAGVTSGTTSSTSRPAPARAQSESVVPARMVKQTSTTKDRDSLSR